MNAIKILHCSTLNFMVKAINKIRLETQKYSVELNILHKQWSLYINRIFYLVEHYWVRKNYKLQNIKYQS
jgi:hypothetical protein